MLPLSLPAPGTWPPPGRTSTTLAHCLLLALLLHLWAALQLGNVPGGSARPGEGVWGAIDVTLQGATTERAPPAPPLVRPGPVGAAETPRWGGALRDRPSVDATRPGAAQTGAGTEAPAPQPDPGRAGAQSEPTLPAPGTDRRHARVAPESTPAVVPNERAAPAAPPPAPPTLTPPLSGAPAAQVLPQAQAPSDVAPSTRELPAAPHLESVAPLAPVARAPMHAPVPAPAPAPGIAATRPITPILAPQVVPEVAPELAPAVQPPAERTLEALPVPSAARPLAQIDSEDRIDPASVRTERDVRMAPLPELQQPAPPPAPLPAPALPPAPPARPLPTALPPLTALSPVPGIAPAAVPPMAAPALAAPAAAAAAVATPVQSQAAPALPPSAAAPSPPPAARPTPAPESPTAGAPDAGPLLGHDRAPPPSASASAPRLNLELPRMRGGALSGIAAPGVLPLLPRPPETKSKLASDLEKAAKADCRDKYAGAGVIALAPLAADALRKDGGCKW